MFKIKTRVYKLLVCSLVNTPQLDFLILSSQHFIKYIKIINVKSMILYLFVKYILAVKKKYFIK